MIGRRNERARQKHRNDLKKQYSLTSVPRSELDLPGGTVKPSKIYNLDNHFGWTVMKRYNVGDNFFPYMSPYYKKPEIPGREDQQVTYILVMEEGTVIDSGRAKSPKETQTIISGIQIEPPAAIRPEPREILPELIEIKKPPPAPVEKRRKSSCFGGGGGKRSSRDSSKHSKGSKGSKGKKKKKGRRKRSGKSNTSSQQSLEEDIYQAASKEIDEGKQRARKEVEKQRKKRTGPDKWQLRAPAGAEQVQEEGCQKCGENNKAKVKSNPKLLGGLKFTPRLSRKPTERLMETHSGTNQYLYLGRSESRMRRK